MNVPNEEIVRLLCVVSEDLRLRWERVKCQGRSLPTAKKEREAAIALIEGARRKNNLCLCALVVLAIPFIVTSQGWVHQYDPVRPFAGSFLMFLFALPICILLWYQSHVVDKSQTAQETVVQCESDLENFKWSVDSLDQGIGRNPYREFIDESKIIRDLIDAAFEVLYLHDRLESSCKWQPINRPEIINLSSCTEISEGSFDVMWQIATCDFGLTLDKGDIYRQARRKLIDRAANAETT